MQSYVFRQGNHRLYLFLSGFICSFNLFLLQRDEILPGIDSQAPAEQSRVQQSPYPNAGREPSIEIALLMDQLKDYLIARNISARLKGDFDERCCGIVEIFQGLT